MEPNRTSSRSVGRVNRTTRHSLTEILEDASGRQFLLHSNEESDSDSENKRRSELEGSNIEADEERYYNRRRSNRRDGLRDDLSGDESDDLRDYDSNHGSNRHAPAPPRPRVAHEPIESSSSTSQKQKFLKRTTISDDRSEGSEFITQKLALLALKRQEATGIDEGKPAPPSQRGPAPESMPPGPPPPNMTRPGPPPHTAIRPGPPHPNAIRSGLPPPTAIRPGPPPSVIRESIIIKPTPKAPPMPPGYIGPNPITPKDPQLRYPVSPGSSVPRDAGPRDFSISKKRFHSEQNDQYPQCELSLDTVAIKDPSSEDFESEEPKSFGGVRRSSAEAFGDEQLDIMLQDSSLVGSLKPGEFLNYDLEELANARMESKSYTRVEHPKATGASSTNNSNRSPIDPETFRNYIINLQKRSVDLDELRRQLEPSKVQLLYRINEHGISSIFLDHPQWITHNDDTRKLRSTSKIYSFSSYLERNYDVAFVIFRDFDASKLEEDDRRNQNDPMREDNDENDTVPHSSESIAPVSKELRAALVQLFKSSSQFERLATDFHFRNEIVAPYFVIYHTRLTIPEFMKKMPKKKARQLSLLLDYVKETYREEYAQADLLLSRGLITWRFIKYLFKPDDIIVQGKDENLRGFLSKSFLRTGIDPNKRKNEIDVWSWAFDGTFRRQASILTLELEEDDEPEMKIQDLDVRPLSYVQEHVKQRLERRGNMFWKCRIKHLVSFHKDLKPDFESPGDERFMIDTNTFHELHDNSSTTPSGNSKSNGKGEENSRSPHAIKLDPKQMAHDLPPAGNFVFLLPLSLKGYNLRQKKWIDVPVDKIRDVSWNKEAFKSLVLDRKTKDLIEALVSNQISAEKSTDLISGKGNGLILLLHGGPGTGKTLTAESVAEIAEKPLWRVTCGDIGIHPEDVEKYLESVLYLGKLWDCVVLLDEADVFLEQRTLADLQRNALVSVFLRMLEYYDGILILTSNRVGIFDEAFKSRIQLALYYENLNKYQREQIWENFFARLENLGETNIDFDDLRENVGQLAQTKMNGRQIRNAINTARQYIQWKTSQSEKTSKPQKILLDYKHLKDIVETSGKFDLYLNKLQGGNTQDQLAQENGLRLSQFSKKDQKMTRGSDESD